MRTVDEITTIIERYGRGVGATGNALRSMIDAVSGLLTVPVWLIAERAHCGERQARRDLYVLRDAGIIEIDENQPPDAMQTANSYRWLGVSAYERASIKRAREERRRFERERRLKHNEAKREAKRESVAAMIARRVHRGIKDGIELYWQRHSESFALSIEGRALQETQTVYRSKTAAEAISEMRQRIEARRRR